MLGVMQRLALAYGTGSLIGLAINHKYIKVIQTLRSISVKDGISKENVHTAVRLPHLWTATRPFTEKDTLSLLTEKNEKQ